MITDKDRKVIFQHTPKSGETCLRNIYSVCTCPLCAAGNYNPADYQVDIHGFKKDRPLGVSGLMRVKNEARWVAQSIDSCIDALDELIICYQVCTDETPEIIEQKRLQYPDKIKVFFYAPPVYAHDLSKEEFDYACSLPEDSVHLLSNYYNYTLSKATYRYALKIDADQIYFTERMIRLCDAYRCREIKGKSLPAFLAYGYYRLFVGVGRRYPVMCSRLSDFLPTGGKIMEKYMDYLCAQISRTKKPVSLSGINLYKDKTGWRIPAFAEWGDRMLLFNGVNDLLIFTISDRTYYYPAYQTITPEEVTEKIRLNSFYPARRIIERFHLEETYFLYGGFCWYHMKFVDQKEVAGHPLCGKLNFKTFIDFSLSDLNKLLNISSFGYKPHLFSFMYDKKLPNPDNFIKI